MAKKGKPAQRDFSRAAQWGFGAIPRGGYAQGRATKQGPMPQGLLGRTFGKGKAGLRELAPEEHVRRESRLQRLGVPVHYQRMSARHAATAPYVPIDEYRTYGGEHAKLLPGWGLKKYRRNK